MPVIIWILLSTTVISALALVGAVTLVFRENLLKKLMFYLVALSAGVLLGGAFLHLIPESIEIYGNVKFVFLMILAGFSLFFILEQFIHWHHCHRAPSEHTEPYTYMVLLADSIHNFLDGLVVGGAFVVDIRLGLVTSLAVAAHEIPQELGDFGVLVHGGWRKGRALLFNFLTGLTMVVGGVLAWFISANLDISFVLPFAAGNFIYVAASDLVPEIKDHCSTRRNVLYFIAFLAGMTLIYLVA